MEEARAGNNIVHQFKVESFDDYLKVVAGFQAMAYAEARDANHPLFLFRGDKAAYELKASIERFRCPDKSIHVGRKMFQRFKEECSLSLAYNDWDILSLARHFSLPSQYLDWSSSCLVALWFAIHTFDRKEYDLNMEDPFSNVWVLKTDLSDFVDVDLNEDPFPDAHGKTCIFKPTGLEHRIKNQNSFMMRQVYEYKDPKGARTRKPEDMEIKKVDENPIYRNRLWKISLARHAFIEMDHWLQSFGITKGYLFPQSNVFNLDGIKEVVDKVKKEFKEFSFTEGNSDEK